MSQVVVGRSPILGPKAAGGGLISARLQIVGGSTLFGSTETLLWDVTPDWDDIGFDSADYNSTGILRFPGVVIPGEFDIDAFAQLEPQGTCDPLTGSALIAFADLNGGRFGIDQVNEEMSTGVEAIGTKLHVCGKHRFVSATPGANGFTVEVHLFGNFGSMYVSQASLAITRTRAL